jgi:protein-L-isoaspartate(D-aspartate) O-methyltransferase
LTGYDELAKGPELQREEDLRAFLLAPREFFVRDQNKGKEYIDSPLPIGYGATITDPDVMAMMTSALELKPGEKVLEIGTGSGYQSAILSSLTNEVYTIEIIRPLEAETDQLYKSLEADYPAYANIKRKLGDGYYGWEEYAPFDKIIVTCSIDHIPPSLLKQLKVDGLMLIPLGPPTGKQRLMEVKKTLDAEGNIVLSRRDIYNDYRVKFIPFLDDKGNAHTQ